MIDIKFRIWNQNAKSFILDENGKIRIFDLWSWARYVNVWGISGNIYNYIFQKFVLTLDDKTEIYEGDIVSWQDQSSYLDIDGPDGDIMVVEWKGVKFVCRSILGHGEWDADDCQIDKVEGNIFANPELLKNL